MMLEQYGRHFITPVEPQSCVMQMAVGIFLAANRVGTAVDGALAVAQYGFGPLH